VSRPETAGDLSWLEYARASQEIHDAWPDPPKDQDVPQVATLEELFRLAPSSPKLWVRAELANTIVRDQVAAGETGRTVPATIQPWPAPDDPHDRVLRVATERGPVVYKLAETPHVSSYVGRGGLHGVWDEAVAERVPCYLAHWPD